MGKHDRRCRELRRPFGQESDLHREKWAHISGHLQGRKGEVCHHLESELQWVRKRDADEGTGQDTVGTAGGYAGAGQGGGTQKEVLTQRTLWTGKD